ncbi:MAG: hypothetical protein V2I33_26440, partial [Kangiellaceae bacterium]|nr:hypothetical protein [Kangiellaceae bacterium]
MEINVQVECLADTPKLPGLRCKVVPAVLNRLRTIPTRRLDKRIVPCAIDNVDIKLQEVSIQDHVAITVFTDLSPLSEPGRTEGVAKVQPNPLKRARVSSFGTHELRSA